MGFLGFLICRFGFFLLPHTRYFFNWLLLLNPKTIHTVNPLDSEHLRVLKNLLLRGVHCWEVV